MAKQASSFDVDDALCFALYTAHRSMNLAYRPFLTKVGLTYPQFLVMVSLWSEDGRSLKALGEKLMLDSGTLTPLVNRLVQMQLVNKVRDSIDERKIAISLTKKGKAMRAKCSDIPRGMFCKLNLEFDEFVELRDNIKKLTSNLRPLICN